jgi:hypothetical protein
MYKLIGLLLAAIVFVGVTAGILGIIWWLWCFVFGYFWPTGPEQFINPAFLPFAIGWVFILFLLRVIGRQLRHNKKTVV